VETLVARIPSALRRVIFIFILTWTALPDSEPRT